MRGNLLLLLAALSLLGCFDDEVGDYQLHHVTMVAASCGGGVSSDVSEQWISAMRDGPITSFQVARGAGSEALIRQAQFRRDSDGSSFGLSLSGGVEHEYEGDLLAEGTTVGESGLGSDFSVLLETDAIGCHFDFSASLYLNFDEDSFEEATGELLLEVEDTQLPLDYRCVPTSCSVDYRFGATHTSNNPGVLMTVDSLSER